MTTKQQLRVSGHLRMHMSTLHTFTLTQTHTKQTNCKRRTNSFEHKLSLI